MPDRKQTYIVRIAHYVGLLGHKSDAMADNLHAANQVIAELTKTLGRLNTRHESVLYEFQQNKEQLDRVLAEYSALERRIDTMSFTISSLRDQDRNHAIQNAELMDDISRISNENRALLERIDELTGASGR